MYFCLFPVQFIYIITAFRSIIGFVLLVMWLFFSDNLFIFILLGFEVTFVQINGTITSLSETKGFRNYIKAGADREGIRGNIMRIPTSRATLNLFCTKEKFKNFMDGFLNNCAQCGMFYLSETKSTICEFPPSPGFLILRSISKLVHNGEYSSHEHDCQSSVTSADQEVCR